MRRFLRVGAEKLWGGGVVVVTCRYLSTSQCVNLHVLLGAIHVYYVIMCKHSPLKVTPQARSPTPAEFWLL